VPVAPSAPHRKLFIAASLPGGLLLGVLLALVLERFGAPLAPRSTPERVVAPRPAMQPFQAPAMAFAGTSALSPELDRAARNFVRPRGAAPQKPAKPVVLPPVLAELAGSADMRLADWVLDNPASPYALALNTLLEALMPHRDAVGRVVAVAAPAAEASKSVALLALGRVAATRGVRTVLLDADLGRLVPASPQTGLSAYLAGQPLASLLRKDLRTHLQVMAASGPVWADPRADGLLLTLKQNFDLILIDAPAPLIQGPWPKLAHLADSVVVYAQAKAPQAQLDGALRSLVAMSVAAKGLILAA
jgi:Mrp family chromosome partitioning ATPase